MEYSRYQAVPTQKTGKIGTWGEYKLVLLNERELDPRVVPEKDPMIEVTWINHPCFVNAGVTAIVRKSLCTYGRF